MLGFARGVEQRIGEHKFRAFARAMHGSYLGNTLERGGNRLSQLTTLRNTFVDGIRGSHLEGQEAVISDVRGSVEQMYSVLS